MYGPPVDLSFKGICSVTDALLEEPRSGLRPSNTNSKKKYRSRSLHLSNNNIVNLTGFQHVLSHFLAQPSKLGWLDLSFNKLSYIDPILCELLELRVLYLHGNVISDLSQVDKLGELQYLHTVTLHGNPAEKINGYRSHVISLLPRLKTMDFSAVTPEERALAKLRTPKPSKNTKESPGTDMNELTQFD